MKFKTEFKLMNLLSTLGLDGVAWSLRRLHCPVNSKALVLDVGSGGNPYPRANVLLDAYEETFERYHSKLVKDRPLVYGLVENMPFKDKCFDFVIASHVLEHVSDPAAFLSELMRVAKAGYIETPDAFIERLIPFRFHRLEVTERNDRLVIYKKSSWETAC
jgi:ubiquinone/menaquinone biosynthesis C-methylase UbiE